MFIFLPVSVTLTLDFLPFGVGAGDTVVMISGSLAAVDLEFELEVPVVYHLQKEYNLRVRIN